MKRHTAHDRLLALKLQGANHLARVLETSPDESVRLKAALALARLTIPTAKDASADDLSDERPASTSTSRPGSATAASSPVRTPLVARSVAAPRDADASAPPSRLASSAASPGPALSTLQELDAENAALCEELSLPDPPGLSPADLARRRSDRVARIDAYVNAELAVLDAAS